MKLTYYKKETKKYNFLASFNISLFLNYLFKIKILNQIERKLNVH